MKQILQQFFLYLKVTRDYSHNTIEAYRIDIEKGFVPFLRRLGKDTFSDVTSHDISSYLDYVTRVQGNGTAAQARKLTAIRKLCHFLLNNQLITSDPTAGIKSPNIPRNEPFCLTDEECARLLETVSRRPGSSDRLRDTTVILLILHTGLLVSELLTLKISDIDLTGSRLRVMRTSQGERWLDLDRETVRVLSEYLARLPNRNNGYLFAGAGGGKLHRATIYRIIKRNLEQAGIDKEKHGPHLLRHTFCSRLHRQGISPAEIRALAGHKSISTTMKYVRRRHQGGFSADASD